jgi:hypothetical protein
MTKPIQINGCADCGEPCYGRRCHTCKHIDATQNIVNGGPIDSFGNAYRINQYQIANRRVQEAQNKLLFAMG